MKRSFSRELSRSSTWVRTALGLGVLLVVVSVSLTACGTARSGASKESSTILSAATDSTQPERSETTTTTDIVVTATALSAAATEPPDPSKVTGQSLGEADVETAGLMLQNQFFPALLQGDAERGGHVFRWVVSWERSVEQAHQPGRHYATPAMRIGVRRQGYRRFRGEEVR